MIRPLDPDRPEEVDLVAGRMRETLVEVLDEERADAMFDHDALVERVWWHLDDVPGRRAAVFVAVADGSGEIVGHTIVRVDHDLDPVTQEPSDEQPEIGLFSTTYVAQNQRRSGVGAGLLAHGEAWMCSHGVDRAVTYTDPDNSKLIAMYSDNGYRPERLNPDWLRLSRSLG